MSNSSSPIVQLLPPLRRRPELPPAKRRSGSNPIADLQPPPPGAERIYIPFLKDFDAWMSCETRSRWVAIVPTTSCMTLVTRKEIWNINPGPYWMFVEYRVLSPILAAHGVAVSWNGAQHQERILLADKLHEEFYAAPREVALEFLRQGHFADYSTDHDIPKADDMEMSMEDHLELLASQLSRVYGGGTLLIQKPNVSADYLAREHMISAYGMN
ncbi:MAG TPA: hypothetical protein VIS48_09580 [Candidatus Kryptonia bacterium]